MPGPVPAHRGGTLVIDRCAADSASRATTSGPGRRLTVGALGLSGNVVVGSDLVVTGESPAVLGAPGRRRARARRG